MRALLVLAALVGLSSCAGQKNTGPSAAPGASESADTSSDASQASPARLEAGERVSVRPGATLFADPELTEAWAVVPEHDELLASAPLQVTSVSEGAVCGELLVDEGCQGNGYALRDGVLRFCVHRSSLADVLTQRSELKFDDGTALTAVAGTPIVDGRIAVSALGYRGVDVSAAVPKTAVGRSYQGPDFLEKAPPQQTIPKGSAVAFAGHSYAAGHTLLVSKQEQDRVEVSGGCQRARLLRVVGRPPEVPAASQPPKRRGFERFGVASGATIYSPSGRAIGEVGKGATVRGKPVGASGGRECLALSVLLGEPPTLCFDTGQLESRGSVLPPDEIRRIVRSHLPEVLDCYNTGLQSNPKLAGRVLVEFDISPEGTVASAKSVPSGTVLKDDGVIQCIVDAVRGWTFPQPRGGRGVVITYPFDLAPRLSAAADQGG